MDPNEQAPKQNIDLSQDSTKASDISHDAEELNDDGRDIGEWNTRWPDEAIKHIRLDALYVGVILLLALIGIVETWRGDVYGLLSYHCPGCTPSRLSYFAYIFFGGVLGGTLFGIKYLYKVVARGFWNLDRRLWRIFSPFVSGVLALAMGALLDSGLLGISVEAHTGTYYLSLGFISGYFADSALAKMQEVALTVFGTTTRHKEH